MRAGQQILLMAQRVWVGLHRRMRTRYYCQVLDSMGENCQICAGVLITGHENVVLGDRVVINNHAIIQSCDGAAITIGSDVTISYSAKLITGGLAIGDDGVIHGQHEAKPIVVEDSVWIGAGAIILPGVTLGSSSIVAAGSIVTHDVATRTAVGGVPARVIRKDFLTPS